MTRKVLLVVILGAILSASCGSSPTEPSGPPPTGNFSLTASVMGGGAPVAGGVLELWSSGAGGSRLASKETNGEGKAVFGGLGEGSYKLQLSWVFGFQSPVMKEVNIAGDSNVDFPLNPADSIILDCIQVGNGPCLRDGDTIYWPTDELRFRGRWRGVTVSFDPMSLPGIMLGHSTLSGPETSTLSLEGLTTGEKINKLSGGVTKSVTLDEWELASKKGSFYYPCTCGNVVIDACNVARCMGTVTMGGAKLFTPAPPGGGTTTQLSQSSVGSWTFNLVRRD